jgi:hypothetical protein
MPSHLTSITPAQNAKAPAALHRTVHLPSPPPVCAPREPLLPLATPLSQSTSERSQTAVRPLSNNVPQAARMLTLARAFRPLMRRVPSRITFTLDETATAEQSAATGLLLPVLRPVPTRWFDVALVVDEGASMPIWQQTVEEIRRLLERYGSFRDVRLWYLATDMYDGAPLLFAELHGMAGHRQARDPREVIDPGGRRLILMVSNCVAPGWHTGSMATLLTFWGRINPVAIVQVLPQRLWRRSALGAAGSTRLQAPFAGAPNIRLATYQSAWSHEMATTGSLPLPVVAWEPRPLTIWARMVGGNQVWMPGYVLPLNGNLDVASLGTPVSLSLDERLRRFRANTTPLARRLVGLLAAGPLSLPLMRLIQKAMLPESTHAHLSELFLSGLIRRVTPYDTAVVDSVRYDFVESVREILLKSVPTAEIAAVTRLVSEFEASITASATFGHSA